MSEQIAPSSIGQNEVLESRSPPETAIFESQMRLVGEQAALKCDVPLARAPDARIAWEKRATSADGAMPAQYRIDEATLIILGLRKLSRSFCLQSAIETAIRGFRKTKASIDAPSRARKASTAWPQSSKLTVLAADGLLTPLEAFRFCGQLSRRQNAYYRFDAADGRPMATPRLGAHRSASRPRRRRRHLSRRAAPKKRRALAAVPQHRSSPQPDCLHVRCRRWCL